MKFKNGEIVKRPNGKYKYEVINNSNCRLGKFKVKNLQNGKEYWIKESFRDIPWVRVDKVVIDTPSIDMFPIF